MKLWEQIYIVILMGECLVCGTSIIVMEWHTFQVSIELIECPCPYVHVYWVLSSNSISNSISHVVGTSFVSSRALQQNLNIFILSMVFFVCRNDDGAILLRNKWHCIKWWNKQATHNNQQQQQEKQKPEKNMRESSRR